MKTQIEDIVEHRTQIEEKFARVLQWILDGGHVFEISEEEAELLWTQYRNFEEAFTRRQRKKEASRKRRAERFKRLSRKYGNIVIW